MRRVVFILLLLVLAGCDAQEDAATDTTPAETRSGSDGVSVALPAGWHTMPADDGVVSDPVARVAVSSGPMRNRGTECQVADYGPESDAVALIVLEWQPNPDLSLGPRPAHFGPAELPVTQGTIECFDGSGGAVEFEDNGRMFGAYLLLGPNAPASLADEARAVLETLRVESAKR